jgi:hypothetical protein
MVTFKEFCKIKYPNWLDSGYEFKPCRPNIDELYSNNDSEVETIEFLTFLNKGWRLSSSLRNY